MVRTSLDPRYSDPTAVAVGWEDTRQLLEAAELFWICTVRTDGRPHVTPLVAVWYDGALYFHTGAREQKFANLSANPHVTLITGCNRWDGGIDVVVDGDATPVHDSMLLTQLAAAWGSKWDGRWQLVAQAGGFQPVGRPGSHSEVFCVTPKTVYAHAKGDPFGHTRHQL